MCTAHRHALIALGSLSVTCTATLSTLDDVVVIDGEEIVLFGTVISLVSIKQNHQEAKTDSCPLPISISVGAWWVVYGQLRG